MAIVQMEGISSKHNEQIRSLREKLTERQRKSSVLFHQNLFYEKGYAAGYVDGSMIGSVKSAGAAELQHMVLQLQDENKLLKLKLSGAMKTLKKMVESLEEEGVKE